MRSRFRGHLITKAVLVPVMLWLAVSPAAGQVQVPRIPRMPDNKPNFTGVWQALGTAYWDIQDHSPQAGPFYQLGAIGAIPGGQGIVEGNEIPYQPWAAEKKKQNALTPYRIPMRL